MKPGQHIMVRREDAYFIGDILAYRKYEAPAVFVTHASKPWYPGACIVDYGNGPRKCELHRCRSLTLRERITRACDAWVRAYVHNGSPW